MSSPANLPPGRLGGKQLLRDLAWDARAALGLKPKSDPEIFHRLRKLTPHGDLPGTFSFPWGRFEYQSPGCLQAQFGEIFVGRQYAFTPPPHPPVIVDCGGNMGLSAIWFRLNYPGCKLIVYEANPGLAGLLARNLERAGIRDVEVRAQAVWTQEAEISFSDTGCDIGAITPDGKLRVPAIDLSARLPESVDLLKMDIEGAEFAVLKHLCATGRMRNVRYLICELHVLRGKEDELVSTLDALRQSGMQFAFRSEIEKWLGLADEAPFAAVRRNQVLMELFAWRP